VLSPAASNLPVQPRAAVRVARFSQPRASTPVISASSDETAATPAGRHRGAAAQFVPGAGDRPPGTRPCRQQRGRAGVPEGDQGVQAGPSGHSALRRRPDRRAGAPAGPAPGLGPVRAISADSIDWLVSTCTTSTTSPAPAASSPALSYKGRASGGHPPSSAIHPVHSAISPAAASSWRPVFPGSAVPHG